MEILEQVRAEWAAHPDDYDPTDAQMLALIESVQREARAQVAELPALLDRACNVAEDVCSHWEGDPIETSERAAKGLVSDLRDAVERLSAVRP